jgi:hypothetical protein
VGLSPIARWRAVLQRARQRGAFVGVDTQAYPRDFATFTRYHRALQRQIGARYPRPSPFTLGQLEAFLEQESGEHRAQWIEGHS